MNIGVTGVEEVAQETGEVNSLMREFWGTKALEKVEENMSNSEIDTEQERWEGKQRRVQCGVRGERVL